MEGELVGIDSFPLTALADKFTGDSFGFTSSHCPPHHLTAEDVQNGVEVVMDTPRRTWQLRNIPCPALVRSTSLQPRDGVQATTGMTATTTLEQQSMILQQAVHLPDTAEIRPFVQEGVEHLGRRKVAEPLGAQYL
jgi:hypothetical protein